MLPVILDIAKQPTNIGMKKAQTDERIAVQQVHSTVAINNTS
jgi:hypothetical protein